MAMLNNQRVNDDPQKVDADATQKALVWNFDSNGMIPKSSEGLVT